MKVREYAGSLTYFLHINRKILSDGYSKLLFQLKAVRIRSLRITDLQILIIRLLDITMSIFTS